VASGDGEQEMITDFFPQIQDSTENHASIRSGNDLPVHLVLK
jgi:predicted PolB exonuclease-like 3'-5' exonuclease